MCFLLKDSAHRSSWLPSSFTALYLLAKICCDDGHADKRKWGFHSWTCIHLLVWESYTRRYHALGGAMLETYSLLTMGGAASSFRCHNYWSEPLQTGIRNTKLMFESFWIYKLRQNHGVPRFPNRSACLQSEEVNALTFHRGLTPQMRCDFFRFQMAIFERNLPVLNPGFLNHRFDWDPWYAEDKDCQWAERCRSVVLAMVEGPQPWIWW